jgi:hypothetical protein
MKLSELQWIKRTRHKQGFKLGLVPRPQEALIIIAYCITKGDGIVSTNITFPSMS